MNEGTTAEERIDFTVLHYIKVFMLYEVSPLSNFSVIQHSNVLMAFHIDPTIAILGVLVLFSISPIYVIFPNHSIFYNQEIICNKKSFWLLVGIDAL